uniref:Pentatricopeptide repeat-containing protein n=1 Tax=Globodera pallida TaxID=36090 RepID=A0A183C9Z7_GLOPA
MGSTNSKSSRLDSATPWQRISGSCPNAIASETWDQHLQIRDNIVEKKHLDLEDREKWIEGVKSSELQSVYEFLKRKPTAMNATPKCVG